MNTRAATLAAFCLLLLPSCVFFPHLGQRIREPGEVYTGVGMRPVDSKIYKLPYSYRDIDGKLHHSHRYYARVPELTFCRKSQLFYCDALHKNAYHAPACRIRPTGRVRVAEFELNKDMRPDYVCSDSIRDDMPEGVTLSHRLSEKDHLPVLAESWHYPHTKASWSRRIAAAPFDYAIDPALKTIFYTGEAAWFLALTPFAAVYMGVDKLFPQEQDKSR